MIYSLSRYRCPPSLRVSVVLYASISLISIGLASIQAAAQDDASNNENQSPKNAQNTIVRDTNPNNDEIISSDDSEIDDSEIVVTAERIKGSVISDIPPISILTEDDIASYGVASIQDLITALEPQTGSSRRRSSGPPIVLINAQRVSGFRELRNIPPEAIKRVEILPEEVALQYGFKPDQRVINFILKEDFKNIDVNASFSLPEAGGYNASRIGSTYAQFSSKSRFSTAISYDHSSALDEDERNIIQENTPNNIISAGTINAQDIGQFRTLLPKSDTYNINSVYSTQLSKTTNLSLNVTYTRSETLNLFGLNSAILTVPSTNLFNNSGADILVQRFSLDPRPLQSTNDNDNYQIGASLNSRIGSWQYTSTLNANHSVNQNIIDQNNGLSVLQQQLQSDNNINPFADILAFNIQTQDFITSDIKTTSFSNFHNISGILFNLPNGEVTANFSGQYSYNRIDSDSDQSGFNVNTILSRNILELKTSLDFPILDEGVGIGRILGAISINANAGASDVSDIGSLTQYGYGIIWKPLSDLTLSFTAINEEAAPSIAQLGNPIITTPNLPIFDFIQSQTSFITLTSGGNPNLNAERRKDIKISLNYSPKKLSNLNFIADYSRNRSFDTSNSFPLLTPEIEAAFPDRVIRDTDGTLLALDRTPVTYDRVESDRIRYGISFSKRLGPNPRNRGGGRPAFTRSRPPGRPNAVAKPVDKPNSTGRPRPNKPDSAGTTKAANEKPNNGKVDIRKAPSTAPTKEGTRSTTQASPSSPNASRPTASRPTANRSRGRPRRPGRFNVSLFHTIALNENILIRPGVNELDLLNGSAIGGNGGANKHSIQLEAGIFNNGVGARVSSSFTSASTVNGNILTGANDLRFGSLARVNFRLFLDIDSKKSLTKALPLLKGSRLSFSVDNITNSFQKITDSNGDTPRNFQRGFIDPRGRLFRISFRKKL